jgi:acetyl esterase/lipase
MKLKVFILLFAISLTILSCSKSTSNNTVAAKVILNVPYGNDTAQTMDIYLPANRDSTTKALLLIHGGAWQSGDKNDFNQYVDTFQKRLPDYAIFNLNYRLANPSSQNTNSFPTQEQDINSATQFILNNENNYLISNKWCILGASSGAHLAMLQAFKNNQTIKPKVVIDFFGPTDMTDLYSFYSSNSLIQYGLSLLLNGTPTTNAILYSSSSPINFLVSSSPPTLILHGGLDDVVPYRESVSLHNKLTILGVPNKYVFYQNQGHGQFTGADDIDSHNQIVSFIKSYML